MSKNKQNSQTNLQADIKAKSNFKPNFKSNLKMQIDRKIILFALFFVIINIVAGYGVILLGADIKGIYSSLNKPFFAPPVWLFGVAWTVNNLLVLLGNYWTLELPKTALRNNLIKFQVASWVNYALFQYLSFGSPVLFGKLVSFMFFLPTFSMLILTIVSMVLAYRLDTQDYNQEFRVYTGKSVSVLSKIQSGKSIFMTFTSLVSWLLIASVLGLYIWLNN